MTTSRSCPSVSLMLTTFKRKVMIVIPIWRLVNLISWQEPPCPRCWWRPHWACSSRASPPCLHQIMWTITRTKSLGTVLKILTCRLVDKEVSFHSAVLDWPGHTKQMRKLNLQNVSCLVQRSIMFGSMDVQSKFVVAHFCPDFVIELDHGILFDFGW